MERRQLRNEVSVLDVGGKHEINIPGKTHADRDWKPNPYGAPRRDSNRGPIVTLR